MKDFMEAPLERKEAAPTDVKDAVKDAVKTVMTSFEEFKSANDERLKELEAKGASDPLLDEKLAKINAELDKFEGFSAKLEKQEKTAQALDELKAQFGGLVSPLFGAEGRQDRLVRQRHVGAAPGDDQGVVDRFRQVGEQRPHFLRRLEIVFRRQAAAVGLVQLLAGGDADQGVMALVMLAFREEHIVGGNQRQVAVIGQFQEGRLGTLLLRQAVALQLHIEAAGKQPFQPLDQGGGSLALARQQQPAERPVGAAGEGDDVVGVAVQIVPGEARFALDRAFQKRAADQRHQVLITPGALGIGGQVGDGAVVRLQHRQQRADDRLHARIGGG